MNDPQRKDADGTRADAEVGNYAQTGFTPHGTMEIRKQGAIVTGHARGPFNTEFMQAYGAMWRQHLADWAGDGALAVHTVWAGSMLTSPDALKLFDEMMGRAAKALPPKTLHIWTVPPGVEARLLMLPVWSKIMNSHGLAVQVFDSQPASEAAIDAFLAQAG